MTGISDGRTEADAEEDVIKNEPGSNPELTRKEMNQLAQKKVDELKAAGKLPTFEQVLNDVQDLIQ